MVRQLEKSGRAVAMVALMDVADVRAKTRSFLRVRRRWASFAQGVRSNGGYQSAANRPGSPGARSPALVVAARHRNAKTARLIGYELGLRYKWAVDARRIKALRSHVKSGVIPDGFRGPSVLTICRHAFGKYKPGGTLAAPTFLFCAGMDEVRYPDDDEPLIRRLHDPLFGWGPRMVGGPQAITTFDVPGGHAGMLQEPHVATAARGLCEAIDRITNGDGSRGIVAAPESVGVVSAGGIESPASGRTASVLIVIVNYKTADLAVNCLVSLAGDPSPPDRMQVVVVENHSGQEQSLAQVIADRGWGNWVRLEVADRNGGFAYGNNRAIRRALATKEPPNYVLLLNADTEARPGAVRALVEFMDSHPNVGMAGSSFESRDGSLWPRAFRFITPLSELERGLRFGPATRLLRRHVVPRIMAQDHPQPADWVAGASLMIRREVFETIGLMDEGYFLYYEEVDFCRRAHRAGWPVLVRSPEPCDAPRGTKYRGHQTGSPAAHPRVLVRLPTQVFPQTFRPGRFGPGGYRLCGRLRTLAAAPVYHPTS